MRYKPSMPAFPDQMKGIKGGSFKVNQATAEAMHEAKTKKLQ